MALEGPVDDGTHTALGRRSVNRRLLDGVRWLVSIAIFCTLPTASLRADEALATLLERHRLDPSNANLCQQIGVAYTREDNFAQAEKFFREAIHFNPRFWAAQKNLGTVLWFQGRKDESEREFLSV